MGRNESRTDELLRLGGRTLRAGWGVVAWSERQVLGLLRSRLDAVAPPRALPAPTSAAASPDMPGERFRDLLERAVEQTTSEGRHSLLAKLVDQLVPDEARIIGALSDGAPSPVISVFRRTATNGVGETVLKNVALVGRTANLALPELTSTYVNHLLTLNLVSIGEETSSLKTDYEILAADPQVLRALKEAGRGPIPARVERGTLVLTPLGLELWEAVDQRPRK